MIENVTHAREPRPNLVYGVGGCATRYNPVAVWSVDRVWRPVDAVEYQDLRRHPWTDVVQGGHPFGLFDNYKYNVDLSIRAAPVAARLRSPPSGTLPVIVGKADAPGVSPWYGGAFPGNELPIPAARVYGSTEQGLDVAEAVTSNRFGQTVLRPEYPGSIPIPMQVDDYTRFRDAASGQGTSGASTPRTADRMTEGIVTPGAAGELLSPNAEAMQTGEGSSGGMTPLARAMQQLSLAEEGEAPPPGRGRPTVRVR